MWKNKSEINKCYLDHLDSLESWGGEYDPKAVAVSWTDELAAFDEYMGGCFS